MKELGVNVHHAYEGKSFRNAEEELQYLRQMIAIKEAQHLDRLQKERGIRGERGDTFALEAIDQYEASGEREKIIQNEIAHYSAQDADRVLHEHFRAPETEQAEIVLPLTPEAHDKTIESLIARLHTEGILNTIRYVQQFQNPHLDDDFHRFLVQYIKKGLQAPGLKEKSPENLVLRRTLYEVSLPEAEVREGRTTVLKELISSMEQFYAGMLSTVRDDTKESIHNQFAIELAVSEGSDEFVFYVSVPDIHRNLFEKQFLAIFPDAKISEKQDDYNIFNVDGISLVSVGTYAKNDIFPIRTYESFDFDPLNVLLNALSQIKKEGEGASIQFIFNPKGDYYTKESKKEQK
jgi:hypothetical protein